MLCHLLVGGLRSKYIMTFLQVYFNYIIFLMLDLDAGRLLDYGGMKSLQPL